jgi:predicted CoA-binding protein
MDDQQRIKQFLAAGPYAVVGASTDREKYGNKVLRCYVQHGLEVYAVNPNHAEVEGVASYPDLQHVPAKLRGISVITPPHVTEKVAEAAAASGVGFIWMQPGAESPEAIASAEKAGLSVIAGGPCLLVALGFRDE